MDSLDITWKQIERLGIVASIRCRAPVDIMLELGDALHAVPLTAVMIGSGSTQPWAAIAEFRRRYGASMAVGAGSLRSLAHTDAAIDAGVQFIVSGTYDHAIGERCRRRGVLYVPGAQHAAEVARAVDAGWKLTGFFPAGRLGPDRLAHITAARPDAHMMVMGGVDAGNLRRFVHAGARAAIVRGVLGTAARWHMGEVIKHVRRLRVQWDEECRLT